MVLFWSLSMWRAIGHIRKGSARALDSGESGCLCNVITNSMQVADLFKGGGIDK